MPGTVEIRRHDGATKDVRCDELPVVNEPELGLESVAVGAAPAGTGPAPEDAVIAIVESDVNVRCRVRQPGSSGDADPTNSKPLQSIGFGTDSIGVAKDYIISFVEV